MRFTPSQFAQALLQSLQDAKKGDVEPRVASFVALVRRMRATALFPRIIEHFSKLWDEIAETEEVTVHTAHKLTPILKKELLAAVGALPDATILEEIDPTLIGGVTIRRGDTIIDGSVRAALASLSQTLTH